jgi:hypothetical protein
MNDAVYAEGVFGSQREQQPDFVVGGLAIDKARFTEWLASQDADEKGFVRLNVLRQKANPLKWSVSLDTWKPTSPSGNSAPPDSDELGF